MTRKTTILIVDDDPDLRKLVRTSLENGRRVIHEAETAIEGLHLARQTMPDILLLDIGLPGHFDGFSLCKAVDDAPEIWDMKIVVISGHDAAEDFNQAERYGVDAYLVKPFSPRILVDLIERLEVPPGEMLVVPAESGFSGNTASN
jgi:CheY-like chemotaxis protein